MKEYKGNWGCVLGILLLGIALVCLILVFAQQKISEEIASFALFAICVMWGSFNVITSYDDVYCNSIFEYTIKLPEWNNIKKLFVKEKYNWKEHFERMQQ